MTDASNTVRHLAVGAGKDGNLYLVSRDKMGGYNSSSNQIYQQIAGALPGGIWSAPAYYNNLLYYGPVGQPILAFQFSKAMLLISPVAQTANSFAYPGATPSVSAYQNIDGIVWAAENTDPAVLHAYDATTLQEFYNSNQAFPAGATTLGLATSSSRQPSRTERSTWAPRPASRCSACCKRPLRLGTGRRLRFVTGCLAEMRLHPVG